MANDWEWRTVQYFVEIVKGIKCFCPTKKTRKLPYLAKVNTMQLNGTLVSFIHFLRKTFFFF